MKNSKEIKKRISEIVENSGIKNRKVKQKLRYELYDGCERYLLINENESEEDYFNSRTEGLISHHKKIETAFKMQKRRRISKFANFMINVLIFMTVIIADYVLLYHNYLHKADDTAGLFIVIWIVAHFIAGIVTVALRRNKDHGAIIFFGFAIYCLASVAYLITNAICHLVCYRNSFLRLAYKE